MRDDKGTTTAATTGSAADSAAHAPGGRATHGGGGTSGDSAASASAANLDAMLDGLLSEMNTATSVAESQIKKHTEETPDPSEVGAVDLSAPINDTGVADTSTSTPAPTPTSTVAEAALDAAESASGSVEALASQIDQLLADTGRPDDAGAAQALAVEAVEPLQDAAPAASTAELDEALAAGVEPAEASEPEARRLDLDEGDEPTDAAASEPVAQVAAQAEPEVGAGDAGHEEANVEAENGVAAQADGALAEAEPEPEAVPEPLPEPVQRVSSAAPNSKSGSSKAVPATLDELDGQLAALTSQMLDKPTSEQVPSIAEALAAPPPEPEPVVVAAAAVSVAAAVKPEAVTSVADELAARGAPRKSQEPSPKGEAAKGGLGALGGRVKVPGAAVKSALGSAGGVAQSVLAGPMRALLPLAAILGKPLAGKPELRDTLGWVASVTLFTAGTLWMYYLGFHEPPKLQAKSTPTGLDDGSGEHASAGHGEAGSGHGDASGHGSSHGAAGHGSTSKVKYAVSAFKPEEKEAKGGAKKPEAKKGGGGGGGH